MQEDFLHYVWKSKSFDLTALVTTQGESVSILTIGSHNDNAGPDFLEAKVKIGGITWSGSVEIHLKSSMWQQHQHTKDPAYENVVLHVVWEHDREILHPDGQMIPCLQLKGLVDPSLIQRYETLVHQITDIPCGYALPRVVTIQQQRMLEKTAIERLQQKASFVLEILQTLQQDWEEVCYRMTLAGFGMKVNKSSFVRLAEILPYRLVRKHADQADLVAALFFGQSGLLNEVCDDYSRELSQHYDFLCNKYDLKTSLERPQWKFSRLRPANFPSLRIAQATALFSKAPALFDRIVHFEEYTQVEALFKAAPNPYWLQHSDFGRSLAKKSPSAQMGKNMVHHLMINVLAPILVAASKYFDRTSYMDKAVQWLEQVPAESNKITRKYDAVGFKFTHALDSQGALALYYEYCLKKKCLHCNIGTSILR